MLNDVNGPAAKRVAVVILSKAPIAGRVKTRLSPPCTPSEAAAVAEACLLDTIDAVAATSAAGRRVLAIDGPVGLWCPHGFDVVPQRGGGLDERLAAAFDDVGGPVVLVGMDTPQVTPELLTHAVAQLQDHDSVIGPAADGGYWLIGLRVANPKVFLGVPMSTDATCAAQLERLADLGLRVSVVQELRDVDTAVDAVRVAESSPWTRLAAAVDRIDALRSMMQRPAPIS